MKTRSFKTFFEAVDIFGFDKKTVVEDPETETKPIRQFDIELMMHYLSKKTLGLNEANYNDFMNVITWGQNAGAIKLEIDTGYTFKVQRLNYDLGGTPRWATKKMFQLNRRGIAGFEDMIANEIYEHIQRVDKNPLDAPNREFKETDRLAWYFADVLRKSAKPLFLWKGIKKLDEHLYQIIFEARAAGVGDTDHRRIENNVTQVAYDETDGIIRVTNYNIESSVGGSRSWTIDPIDLDLYFFPTQTKEEMGDALAVFFKYY